jgi:hypothetical protein
MACEKDCDCPPRLPSAKAALALVTLPSLDTAIDAAGTTLVRAGIIAAVLFALGEKKFLLYGLAGAGAIEASVIAWAATQNLDRMNKAGIQSSEEQPVE